MLGLDYPRLGDAGPRLAAHHLCGRSRRRYQIARTRSSSWRYPLTGMLWPRDAVARPTRCPGPCSCAKGSAVRRQVGHLLTRAGLRAALAILESCTWSGIGMTGRTDIDAAIIRQWYSDKRQLIRLRWPGYDTTLCCAAVIGTADDAN